jgi:radical SAM superfamily enzyme YgiQ (UPF0313 family)
MKIWLTDLTYTQQSIASDILPAAIGMIAEYASTNMEDSPEFKLFKYPDELIDSLENDSPPDVFACSNYVWNSSLSSMFCQQIKEAKPEVITVMGGPNFPSKDSEVEKFVKERPWVDYFIVKEGELPFCNLLKYIDGDNSIELDNVVRLNKQTGEVEFPNKITRTYNLEAISSPYISGRLDEFLDGRLMPVIQTNRGCPFTCTFCTEGQGYWNKVKRKDKDLVHKEVRYISNAMASLPSDKRRTDLLIADSNFGMYKDDLEVCEVIADEQHLNGYPEYINVSTGKNRKARVLEAARLVNGAMKLAGSVQSLDIGVLKNIKRDNISKDEIVALALDAEEVGTNTYSEVILALPGDSIDAHFSSLEILVKSNFNTVVTYQLMMLPGTELGSEKTKEQYEMVTKFRVQPRCFGTYDIFSKQVSLAEIEEICVSNSTLPYSDYLKCRKLHFIVNLFYNDGIFSELRQLLSIIGVSSWQWIYNIYSKSHSTEFDDLINKFIDETEGELWDSREDLMQYMSDPDIVKKYIDGEKGNNLLFYFKAISMTSMFNVLCEVASSSIKEVIYDNKTGRDDLVELATDIVKYKKAQINNIFGSNDAEYSYFNYDIELFSNLASINSVINFEEFKLKIKKKFMFSHTIEQIETINSYTNLFGNDAKGISRILARTFLKKLMRQPVTG